MRHADNLRSLSGKHERGMGKLHLASDPDEGRDARLGAVPLASVGVWPRIAGSGQGNGFVEVDVLDQIEKLDPIFE